MKAGDYYCIYLFTYRGYLIIVPSAHHKRIFTHQEELFGSRKRYPFDENDESNCPNIMFMFLLCQVANRFCCKSGSLQLMLDNLAFQETAQSVYQYWLRCRFLNSRRKVTSLIFTESCSNKGIRYIHQRIQHISQALRRRIMIPLLGGWRFIRINSTPSQITPKHRELSTG